MPEALGKSCITADPDQAGNMDFTAFAFVEPFTKSSPMVQWGLACGCTTGDGDAVRGSWGWLCGTDTPGTMLLLLAVSV